MRRDIGDFDGPVDRVLEQDRGKDALPGEDGAGHDAREHLGFWNLGGAGIFGCMINPPIALFYMQGLNTTPVHAHAAFFGVADPPLAADAGRHALRAGGREQMR